MNSLLKLKSNFSISNSLTLKHLYLFMRYTLK